MIPFVGSWGKVVPQTQDEAKSNTLDNLRSLAEKTNFLVHGASQVFAAYFYECGLRCLKEGRVECPDIASCHNSLAISLITGIFTIPLFLRTRNNLLEHKMELVGPLDIATGFLIMLSASQAVDLSNFGLLPKSK